MNIQFLLFIASIPIILMCVFIYKKDNDKEPTKILRKLFIFGVLSIVPIIILELVTDKIIVLDNNNPIMLFINVFVTVGLIEEGIKWVIVNKTVFNDIEFNHAYDAIIYAVFVSLGFALIENILYVISSDIKVALLRGITTIPAHTFNAIIMGYFLGKAKQEDYNNNDKLSKKYMFLSLLVPILCHSLYDFLIFMQTTNASVLFIVLVVIMYVISYKIVRDISILSKNFDGTKYNSKERTKHISDSNIFTGALIKILVITLILIGVAAVDVLI